MPETSPRVLFATDFSDGSEPAAEVALAYARRLGARLHVLHVTRVGWEDEMLEVLRDHVQRFAGVPVTAAVETGSAADRIVAYADRVGAEVVILGAHGRTGFTRALLGSVAERVARTAHCPVMTVPRDLASPLRPLAADAVRAATTADVAPPVDTTPCLLCQAPTRDSICEPCRTRLRSQAAR